VPDGAAPDDPSTPLLRRWQEDGDPEALDQLLQVEVGLLKHMIHGRRSGVLAGSASTSDIAQEAVLGLLRTKKAPTFADPGSLRGYLWRSAWHLLVKRFEKKSKTPLRLEIEDPGALAQFLSDAPTFEHLDREERGMAIGLAMNLLSQEDRDLLRRVYFEGGEVTAAAAQLGLSRSAANSRLVRARRLLATRLSEWSDLIG
jgi:RNA polymerase sigma factor (sigma-70 family)